MFRYMTTVYYYKLFCRHGLNFYYIKLYVSIQLYFTVTFSYCISEVLKNNAINLILLLFLRHYIFNLSNLD